VKPQFKHTVNFGKTHTIGLSRPLNPGKWSATSPLNVLWLVDRHDLQNCEESLLLPDILHLTPGLRTAPIDAVMAMSVPTEEPRILVRSSDLQSAGSPAQVASVLVQDSTRDHRTCQLLSQGRSGFLNVSSCITLLKSTQLSFQNVEFCESAIQAHQNNGA